MSYRTFEAYKDSGIDWLGDIPRNWQHSRIKYVSKIETGDGDTQDAEVDAEYPFFVRSPIIERIGRYSHDTEAVLTAGDGAGVGKIFHRFRGKFSAHQRVYIVSKFVDVDPGYFYFYFSTIFGLVALDGSAKSTVESVRRPMIADLAITLPPLVEQKQIADFLDRETAQIDNLIAEQEGLVENLTERRAAAIDQTVLGGLDVLRSPAAAVIPGDRTLRKGSHLAVEPELLKMPNNWKVVRFKAAMQRLDERNVGSKFTMMSLKISGEVVPRASLNSRQEPSIEGIPRYLIARQGDLVVNPMWLTGGSIGVSQVVGAVSPDYRVFRSRGFHEPRYLHHLMRSRPYIRQYKLYTRSDTTFDRRVQQGDLDNLPVAVPPLEEQREIADYLDGRTFKTDALIEEAKALIDLLKERRSALISAAVTGKIDVRSEVLSRG